LQENRQEFFLFDTLIELSIFIIVFVKPSFPLTRTLRLSEWASLETHLLWIYDAKPRFPKGEGRVVNQHMSAWLIRKGQVGIRMGGHDITAAAGHWIFLGQGERWQQFSPDCHLLSVRFSAFWPSGEDLFARDQCQVVEAKEAPKLEAASLKLLRVVRRHFRRSLVFLMQEQGTMEAHFDIHVAFCSWFVTYWKALAGLGQDPAHIGPMDSRVERAHEMILRHPLDQPFDEKSAATSVGLSSIQLNRLFLKQFGRTMRRAVEERRLEQAIHALSGTSAPIKQIAYDLGFGSLAHFSTWFRRRKNIYPQVYRRTGTPFY
jgi:AraC-like DNA-binding protein